MRFGIANFEELDKLLWKSNDHFGAFRDQIRNFQSTLAKGVYTEGVISGCEVSAGGGLTLNLAPGIVMFPSGEMVSVEAQSITLPIANPANPRLDRIELAYSLENGPNVTLTDGTQKVFQKFHTGTVQANVGTPAGSPVANVKTAGRITLAVVSVAAGQTVLVAGDIDSSDDTSTEYAAVKLGTQTARIRKNRKAGVLEVTDNGTDWAPIGTTGLIPLQYPIYNNQVAPLDLLGFIFDHTKIKGIRAFIQIERTTDAPEERIELGELYIFWKPKSLAWDGTYSTLSGDAETTLAVDPATGQMKYTSSSLPGANYSGNLSVTDIQVQKV